MSTQAPCVVIDDDDELILRVLSRVLGATGFRTSCFLTPVEALTRLASEEPAVIICDYVLPWMNGVAFLKQARAQIPDAARILCTAAEDSEVARDAIDSGDICCIIPKPWHYQELVTTVKEAAESSRLHRESELPRAEAQRQSS